VSDQFRLLHPTFDFHTPFFLSLHPINLFCSCCCFFFLCAPMLFASITPLFWTGLLPAAPLCSLTPPLICVVLYFLFALPFLLYTPDSLHVPLINHSSTPIFCFSLSSSLIKLFLFIYLFIYFYFLLFIYFRFFIFFYFFFFS